MIKLKYHIVLILFFWGFNNIHAQIKNDFRIGIFGATFKTYQDSLLGLVPYAVTTYENYPTSVLNVLSEDGFNTYVRYEAASCYITENAIKNELLLANKNRMKVHLGLTTYFSPILRNDKYFGEGNVIMDACGKTFDPYEMPYYQGYYRPNFSELFKNVYTKEPFKNYIWGYHLGEELEYCHLQNMASNCKGNEGWQEISTNQFICNHINHQYPYFYKCEIPPNYFKQVKNTCESILYENKIHNQHLVLMPANHGKSINNNTEDDNKSIFDTIQNKYIGFNAPEYIKQMNGKFDVIFEGSYTMCGDRILQTKEKYKNISQSKYHYLGQFKSIEYCKQFSSSVHKVISIENYYFYDKKGYLNTLHYDTAVKNANWLWFQTYTSIIHGADGIWFWWLHDMWGKDENRDIWGDVNKPDRYNREYFPKLYKNYLSHLTRELSFLVQLNLLSSDTNSIVLSKTDKVLEQMNIPKAKKYIKSNKRELRNEHYGIRYTIRTNGRNTIIILSNPLLKQVDIQFNINKIADSNISKSNSCYLLFEDSLPQLNNHYKINRKSIHMNESYIKYFQLPINKNKINLTFGPLDTHILWFGNLSPQEALNLLLRTQ